MSTYWNARSVAAVCAVLVTCYLGNLQASEPLPNAAPPASVASLETQHSRPRDQETVISAERTKAEAVPEPTGLLMSCLLGGVLLAIGQRLRSWRGGAV